MPEASGVTARPSCPCPSPQALRLSGLALYARSAAIPAA